MASRLLFLNPGMKLVLSGNSCASPKTYNIRHPVSTFVSLTRGACELKFLEDSQRGNSQRGDTAVRADAEGTAVAQDEQSPISAHRTDLQNIF